ncbi:asparagine synthase (glutamine-hydrolyzing) [Bacilliculturomica massiliensis]|uniref:asparagine synthase (glutamine-hydrolyzing) n=1 Tax=Bacilliculturomica massiliensis TaxID=1917867 RepID=UPI0010315602|nr:asparagine synthase (glutamine-hydrolyzing) [Bacilliculturomica massiliensis]
MCGIAGVLDFTEELTIKEVKAMTNIIRHRGPDDEGYTLWGDEGYVQAVGVETVNLRPKKILNIDDISKEKKYFLAFGHRRLSILDLTSYGHQPMTDDSGTVHITFNGEIYNYLELKKQLVEKGHYFKSTCDTEVLIEAYKEWGEDCVKHFNGMWAFAVWDMKEQKLFCSRDRLGAKPLFYYLDKEKGRFVFGSELKQICQISIVPRILNMQTVAVNLVYNISDFNDETLIKDIHLLKPGHSITVYTDIKKHCIIDAVVQDYWKLEVKENHKLSFDESVQLVGENLKKSVEYRLRSDVPIATMLSGGLDSSSLVTEICEQLGNSHNWSSCVLSTYTSCYEESPENDEKNYAQMVNEYHHCNSHYVYPHIEQTDELFKKMVWHLEGVGGYSLLGVMQVIEAVAKDGYKVVINGQGADESLFGYERYYVYYFYELIKQLKWRKLVNEFNLATKNSRCSAPKLFKLFVYFNNPSIRTLIKKKIIKKYCKATLLDTIKTSDYKEMLAPKSLQQLLHDEICGQQLNHILRYDDRLYMAYSIESRVPFIDYEYIESIASIPVDYRIKGGYTKSLLRHLFAGRMPDEVTWRKNKMGFGAPTERWSHNFSEEFIEDIFHEPRSNAIFEVDQLRQLYNQNSNQQILADFFAIELFMRQFDVSID